MATTISTDFFTPDVWAEAVGAEVEKNLVMSNAAVVRTDLENKPGTTVQLPKWNKISKADELTEGNAMVPVKLTQSTREATVQSWGKAVEISELASLTGIGNDQDEAVEQLGQVIAEVIDEKLLEAALDIVAGGIKQADGSASSDAKPFVFNAGVGTFLTYDSIVDATGLAGDKFNPKEWDAYINSADRGRVMKDDTFIAAAQGSGSNDQVSNGVVGKLAGMGVFVSDLIEAGTTLLIKKGSLGLFYKARPVVRTDFDILKGTNVYATRVHFAVGRLNDKGVVVVNWNTAAA